MYNKHLDNFLLVADCGSFSKAAKRAYISPNAMIKQINLLEAELGITLFVRSNHGIRLTDAGKSVYQDTKRIIRLSNQAIEKAKNTVCTQEQSIRIGSSILSPCKTILDLWIPVSQSHPNIKLQITPFDDAPVQLLNTLEHLGNDIDIIAGIYPSGLWQNRCRSLEIMQLPLRCAVPRKHPLATKELLHFSDLYDETLIMIERGDTSYIDILRNEIEQKHPQIHIHDVPVYDINVFNQCEAANSLMISVDIWKEVHPSLVIIPCNWSYSVPYGLIYSLNPTKTVMQFLDAIKKINCAK